MNRIVAMALASLAVLAGAGGSLAQQEQPPAGTAQRAQPPPPTEKSPTLSSPETGTRHPSAGGPETGYHGSSDPKSSTGANLPGENVPPDTLKGSGSEAPSKGTAPSR